jgi:Dna[CI] antecedent, DciA
MSDILCELIAVRGYGRLWTRQLLENAWKAAIGEPYCNQTQVGEIRRGVLSVIVAHAFVLEELKAFRKATLLATLQSSPLGTAIHDIQFQVDSAVFDIKEATESSLGLSEVVVPVGRSPSLQKEHPQSEKEGRSCYGCNGSRGSQEDLVDLRPSGWCITRSPA